MLTCYIIDDEQHAINGLTTYIERVPALKLIGAQQDPVKALDFFQQTNYPHITFLDIEMPNINGIELASLLSGKTQIVFTTAHPGFALEAFDMLAADYLLKPFSFQRFLKCTQKLTDHGPLKQDTPVAEISFFYIQAESKGKHIKILFQDIFYIESQKNYVSIITKEKKYLTYLTLTEMSEQLPSFFLRINKSYIINTQMITHLEGNEVFLSSNNKEGFIIGAAFRDEFHAHMKTHLIKTRRSGA